MYELYEITFDIKHLDSRILRVTKNPNDALHLNDSLRKIPGEGMPVYKSSNGFGDLFVRFNLVIPKTLEQSKLDILKNVFDNQSVLSDTFTKKYLLENISDTDLEDLESDSESESSYTESELSSISSSESEESTKKVFKMRKNNK